MMPMYDFRCNECGAEFEDIIKYENRDQIKECVACKKIAAVRVQKPNKFFYSLNRQYSRMRTGV